MFLPGESQGRGSLVCCCLWGRTESDMTEATEQQQQQGNLYKEATAQFYWAAQEVYSGFALTTSRKI